MTEFAVNKFPLPSIDISIDAGSNPNSAPVADRVQSLAVKGVDPDQTVENAARKDDFDINQAKRGHTGSPVNLVEDTLQQGTLEAQELATKYDESVEKAQVLLNLKDYFIETGIYADDIEYTPTDIRYTTNTLIAEQIIRDRLSKVEEETGTLGTIGDFLDRYLIRQIPIGAVEDLTRRSTREGKELLQAALTMDPEEYRVYITNYVDEIAAEGALTSENLFALREALDKATNAGYDPWAGVAQIFAVAELVPFVKPIAKGGKAIVRGRSALEHADSTVGRIAATEGQDAATDVGEVLLRSGPELDATIVTKTGPAAYDEGTSTVRPRSGKTLEVLENNQIIKKAVALDKKGAFGRAASKAQLDEAAGAIVQSYRARVTNALNNYTITADLGGNPT
jgi:hypothetical protein